MCIVVRGFAANCAIICYPVNVLSKELLKCAKKAAVPNQSDIKTLETVVALVEVSLVMVTVYTW